MECVSNQQHIGGQRQLVSRSVLERVAREKPDDAMLLCDTKDKELILIRVKYNLSPIKTLERF